MANPIDQETQQAAKTIFDKLKEVLKNLVNSTRIPALIDLILKPTIKEALDEAPKASENWARLGLEKTWQYFVPIAIVLLIYFGKNSLQFVIEIVAQFGAVGALFGIGFYLWKSIKK